MAPEDSTYRIEYDLRNPGAWARLSTRMHTTWTFRSARPAGGQTVPVPLLLADYDVPVDLRNRARSNALRLALRHQGGSPGVPLRAITLQASYDDGGTWTNVPLKSSGSGYRASISGRGPVSLRLHAEDMAGNTLTQETIRAYEHH